MNKRKIQALIIAGVILANTTLCPTIVSADNLIRTDENVKIETLTEETSEVLELVPTEYKTSIEEITQKNSADIEIDNWLVEGYSLNGQSIIITQYVGTDTNIVIPRTLDGKKVILKGYRDTFPDNVETITVAEDTTNVGKVELQAPVWEKGIEVFNGKANLKNADLKGLNVSGLANMISMFDGCSSLETLDITGWETQNAQIMRTMFRGCTQLTEIKGIEALDMSNVFTTQAMFSRCASLTQLDLSGWNLNNVETMQGMFEACTRLENIDLSGLETKNVTNMPYMFYGCSSLKELDLSGINTENVTNMQGMFRNCSSLTEVDLSGLETKNVTNMQQMFRGCIKLTDITGIEDFNTSSVENMENMFYDCASLETIDICRWNVSRVTNMQHMFNGCTNLQSINLRGLDTSSVINMRGLFRICSNLNTIIGIEDLNTSSVNNMKNMFYGCAKLDNINFGTNWNTANVNDMSSMFNGCYELSDIEGLDNFNVSRVTDVRDMFKDTRKLKFLDLSNWNLPSNTKTENMFQLVNTNGEDGKLLVITDDEEITNYDFRGAKRTPIQTKYNANHGRFEEKTVNKVNTVDKVAERFTITPEQAQNIDEVIRCTDELVTKPIREGHSFTGWVTNENPTSLIEKLEATYTATWTALEVGDDLDDSMGVITPSKPVNPGDNVGDDNMGVITPSKPVDPEEDMDGGMGIEPEFKPVTLPDDVPVEEVKPEDIEVIIPGINGGSGVKPDDTITTPNGTIKDELNESIPSVNKPEGSNGTIGKLPQTGDAGVAGYVVLGATSLLGALGLIRKRNKK